ncbi:J domain-containing protein [Halarcobacter ebronensis]|uniref:Molecular chaperone DnaJ n=1 Tax=Halarcobacter ebronensis TaxID=1462615 RepID=A0A4Q1AR59_9BACT|nr:J domain-containing protein [Halarcobacter ebronensis]QKF81517.1 DnaJ domain-containing protein [Halarcobacter ebronensis]RXK05447.1 molecular chaperone DnaJ [Halarcobacter ebronensis]
MGRELSYIIGSLIRWGIFFGILYLIFTNFGTFLLILFALVVIAYIVIYQFKKKLREHSNSFRFTFNGQDFRSSSQNGGYDFNFEQFQEQFRRGSFNTNAPFSEVEQAKEFFGFTTTPTKEEIKKRYKELAKKYHPDINGQDDALMQQLNHYKEVLLKAFGN